MLILLLNQQTNLLYSPHRCNLPLFLPHSKMRLVCLIKYRPRWCPDMAIRLDKVAMVLVLAPQAIMEMQLVRAMDKVDRVMDIRVMAKG